MTAQFKKVLYSPVFGMLVIVIACLVMEQIAEFKAKENTLNELRLLISLKKVSLRDYFDSIESELKSAAADEKIQESMTKLNQIWYQLKKDEREQIHELFQTRRSAQRVKQAYLSEKKQKDSQLYTNHLKYAKTRKTAESITKSTNQNVSSAWASVYDASSHLRSKISPEMQSYLDYFSKFQIYGKKFMDHFDYYDVFLITPNGDIVYSYELEDDFATNLYQGPYAQSDLAHVFRLASQQKDRQLSYSAFKPYQPSQGILSSFTAFPIYNGEELVGVMALQFSAEMPSKAIAHDDGVDSKVETYLVDHQHLMITHADKKQAQPHKKARKAQRANNTLRADQNVKLGLAGKRGVTKVRNYKGLSVFSAFTPFNIKSKRWTILAEKPVGIVYNHIRLWWLAACLICLLVYWAVYYTLKYIDHLNSPIVITTYEGAP